MDHEGNRQRGSPSTPTKRIVRYPESATPTRKFPGHKPLYAYSQDSEDDETDHNVKETEDDVKHEDDETNADDKDNEGDEDVDTGLPRECPESILRCFPVDDIQNIVKLCSALRYKNNQQVKGGQKFSFLNGMTPGFGKFTSNQTNVDQLKLYFGPKTVIHKINKLTEDQYKKSPILKKHSDGVESIKKLFQMIREVLPDVKILNGRLVFSFLANKAVGHEVLRWHDDGTGEHDAIVVSTGGDAIAKVEYKNKKNNREKHEIAAEGTYTGGAKWHGRPNRGPIEHRVVLTHTGRIRIALLLDIDGTPNFNKYAKNCKEKYEAIANEKWTSKVVLDLDRLRKTFATIQGTIPSLTRRQAGLAMTF